MKTLFEIPYSLCEPETAQQHREKTLTPEFYLGSRMLNTNMGEGEREGKKGGDRGREGEKKREKTWFSPCFLIIKVYIRVNKMLICWEAMEYI